LPIINQKIDELKRMLASVPKSDLDSVLDTSKFKGLYLCAYGDRSMFRIESIDGY